jgi:hypothetical protein
MNVERFTRQLIDTALIKGKQPPEDFLGEPAGYFTNSPPQPRLSATEIVRMEMFLAGAFAARDILGA